MLREFGVAKNSATGAAYLGVLDAEQRRAVEHGCATLDHIPPLLIIAGAGSGKTNTLAHRVAHLIVSGADPRRMMLLTFSPRAGAEMQRRVERIMANALSQQAGIMTTPSPGPARSTPLARGCCANMQRTLDSMPPSRSMTGRIRPIS
jgi:ATP-dependent exoDNAse (exonuclease V) beta subunit